MGVSNVDSSSLGPMWDSPPLWMASTFLIVFHKQVDAWVNENFEADSGVSRDTALLLLGCRADCPEPNVEQIDSWDMFKVEVDLLWRMLRRFGESVDGRADCLAVADRIGLLRPDLEELSNIADLH